MENIRLGPVLTDRESVPTASCSPVSPFLRFLVTEPSRMISIRTEECHVGHFRKFVGTACCTYGQSNTTIASLGHAALALGGRCSLTLVIFKFRPRINILSISRETTLTRLNLWLVSIGSDNGLVPAGNQPLSELMLTKFYIGIWRY